MSSIVTVFKTSMGSLLYSERSTVISAMCHACSASFSQRTAPVTYVFLSISFSMSISRKKSKSASSSFIFSSIANPLWYNEMC